MKTNTFLYRSWRFTALTWLALVWSACGTSTRFTSTWNAGNAQPVSAQSMQIAAVFFSGNESVRRESEDIIAHELMRSGGVAVPSYTLLADNPEDRERAKRELEKAGVDAVLSMRVVSRERTFDVTPGYWTGPYYGSLWGYWGHGWGGINEPMAVGPNLIVGVETLLYSLKDEKLLWAGMSETVDPDDVESAVKSIVRKAIDEMQEDAVLTPF